MARDLGQRFRRYAYFYLVHVLLLIILIGAYLFYRRPELIDWWTWISAFALAAWSLYNLPWLPRALGTEAVQKYRSACIRHFSRFLWISLAVLVSSLLWGGVMLRELWSRWKYVDAIKQVTSMDDPDGWAFPDPEELAVAFNAFPHRPEVPFLVARMSRLLAFDDELGNFHRFIAAFLAHVDRDALVARYGAPRAGDQEEFATDPVTYLARLIVEADGASKAALEDAIRLLAEQRANDPTANLQRLIYRHELIEQSGLTPVDEATQLEVLSAEIADTLKGISGFSSRRLTHVITSDVYQELLDHYAQLAVTLAGRKAATMDARAQTGAAEAIVQRYVRILTVRKRVVGEVDVPWLNGPGKLTLFHFFKHCAGRDTAISRDLIDRLNQLPGVYDLLRKRTFDAEAFEWFRDLESWEHGTPLDKQFAGTGTPTRLLALLKAGW